LKTSLLKFIVLAFVQIGSFFLTHSFLHFDFSLSYLFSFIFTLLFASLILEGRTIKNTASYVLAFINILFIVVAFFVFSQALIPNPSTPSPKAYSAIKNQEQRVTPKYSKTDKTHIKKAFYYIAFKAYYPALKEIDQVKEQTLMLHKFKTYLLDLKGQMELKITQAKKEIPDFKHHLILYQRGDLTGFMENLLPYRKNPLGDYFYLLAKQTLILKTNPQVLDKTYHQSIQKFVETLAQAPEILFDLLFVLPELKETYQLALAEKQNTAFSFFDFEQISLQSKTLKNYFALINNNQGKEFLIYVEELVFPPHQYPILAFNTHIFSQEGEKTTISLAKINTHTLVFSNNDKTTHYHMVFPDLYTKLKTSLEMVKKPMNPLWLASYKKDYPEIYQTIVKPFWFKFLKLVVALVLGFIVSIFTAYYLKTLFPAKIPVIFYLLPFLFNILLALFYSNMIMKIIIKVF